MTCEFSYNLTRKINQLKIHLSQLLRCHELADGREKVSGKLRQIKPTTIVGYLF